MRVNLLRLPHFVGASRPESKIDELCGEDVVCLRWIEGSCARDAGFDRVDFVKVGRN